jgi:hypothetical protein
MSVSKMSFTVRVNGKISYDKVDRVRRGGGGRVGSDIGLWLCVVHSPKIPSQNSKGVTKLDKIKYKNYETFLLNYAQKFKALIKFKILVGVFFFPPRLLFAPDWPAISISSWQQ